MSPDMMVFAIAGLAFLVLACVGLLLTPGGDDKARRRAKQISTNRVAMGNGRKEEAEAAQRRKQTQQMLDKLRQDGKKRQKKLVPQNMKSKIAQAGLGISVPTFWVLSAVSGILLATGAFLSGAEGFVVAGMNLKSQPVVVGGAGFAGFLGLPRWVLGFLAKSRAKKMTNQFADAIDIIVRGVKSGLPLTECLRIIGRESPAPLGQEFVTLTDNISMGTNFERALQGLYTRVPLPEINFFVIVLAIQAKSGGNLSEALGNLSSVIRSRRMMREKIQALSSEAKSSAMIIGSLPFAVGGMLFVTSPEYLMRLFTTETGHFLLFVGFCMMSTGITVMRKMINFDI